MTTALSKIKLPLGIIRGVAIILVAMITVFLALPYAKGFVEEARSSKAASKGRVLQRGAQIIATRRLVAGDSFREAADYLATDDGVKQILEAAEFPVTAVKITGAALDEKGLLTDFACIVEYEQRRYTVSFDISGQSGTAVFLEEAPKEEFPKKDLK